DKRQIPTATFQPDQREEFLTWVEACGKMPANIYFSVAEPIGEPTEKMSRAQVRAVHWVHVDVDPRPGEDLEAEQSRIVELLRDPPGLPAPSVIVATGGGYAAYWALSDPIPI